jgi:hypothetical protein
MKTRKNRPVKFPPIVVPSQNLMPDILMMQPAKDGNCRDVAYGYRATKVRRIFMPINSCSLLTAYRMVRVSIIATAGVALVMMRVRSRSNLNDCHECYWLQEEFRVSYDRPKHWLVPVLVILRAEVTVAQISFLDFCVVNGNAN